MLYCIKVDVEGQEYYSCLDTNWREKLHPELPPAAKLFARYTDLMEAVGVQTGGNRDKREAQKPKPR